MAVVMEAPAAEAEREVSDLTAAPVAIETPKLRPLSAAVNRETLAEALRFVSRAVPRTAYRPILSCVHLSPAPDNADRLQLRGTDLEVHASATVLAAGAAVGVSEVTGAAAVPAKALAELLKSMRGTHVELLGAEDGLHLTVRSGMMSAVLTAYPATDYPVWPDAPAPEVFAWGNNLAPAFSFVAGAAAEDGAARPLLTGVEVAGTRCLATDGFQARHEVHGVPLPKPIVMPARVAPLLTAMVGPKGHEWRTRLGVAVQGNYATVQSPWGRTIAVRVLEGRYFAVLDLVPKEFPHKVWFQAADLAAALQQAKSVVDQDPPHCVQLEIRPYHLPHTIDLRAKSADLGEVALSVGATSTGPDVIAGFNVRQLLDILKALCGPKCEGDVLLELSAADKLARLRRPDAFPDGRVAFLMPLRMPD